MQEDIVQIGVKRHLQHSRERLCLVLSVYYTCNVVKRLKMGWLYAPVSLDCALFIIYLSYFHRLHCSARRVRFELIQTDLKAYLIIYDMKQSHLLMQSTPKKFITREKLVSGLFLGGSGLWKWFRCVKRSKQVESVENTFAGNSWFH